MCTAMGMLLRCANEIRLVQSLSEEQGPSPPWQKFCSENASIPRTHRTSFNDIMYHNWDNEHIVRRPNSGASSNDVLGIQTHPLCLAWLVTRSALEAHYTFRIYSKFMLRSTSGGVARRRSISLICMTWWGRTSGRTLGWKYRFCTADDTKAVSLER